MLEKFSLMYVSCYTYKSLWMPFIKLKNKYISNIKMYLCTDLIKENEFELNNINVLNFNSKSNFTLKGNLFDRYLYYLNNIDTDYIFYFYDDMYPLDYVDNNNLINMIKIMEENSDIKLIKLSLHSYPFHKGTNVSYNNINFVKANNNLDEYILNLQPILIKKNFFIDLINYCKKHNTYTHQNGGLEVYGTEFFRNTNYIALRVTSDIIKIPGDGGIVRSGIISESMKKMLKDKEDIDIKTYDNNFIYELTKNEYNDLGDRLKEHYANLNIKCIDS
jgi:hypothetical protein